MKANSVLCAQCGKWIHGRCARVKRAPLQFPRNVSLRKYEAIFEEQWRRKRSDVMKWKLYDSLHIKVIGRVQVEEVMVM